MRISEDLHRALRKAAAGRSVNAWIVEAVAEKLGRHGTQADVDELRLRVEQLEAQVRALRRD